MLNQNQHPQNEPLSTDEQMLLDAQPFSTADIVGTVMLDSTAALPVVEEITPSKPVLRSHHLSGEDPSIVARVGEDDLTLEQLEAYGKIREKAYEGVWNYMASRTVALLAGAAVLGAVGMGYRALADGSPETPSSAVPVIAEQPLVANPGFITELPELAGVQPSAETPYDQPFQDAGVQTSEATAPPTNQAVETLQAQPEETLPVASAPSQAEVSEADTVTIDDTDNSLAEATEGTTSSPVNQETLPNQVSEPKPEPAAELESKPPVDDPQPVTPPHNEVTNADEIVTEPIPKPVG